MLANNVILILMIVFTYAILVIPAFWIAQTVPPMLDRRKQRRIAELQAGAEMLADAISRNHNDPVHLARLTTNRDAHVRALMQLGGTVPSASADGNLARAA